MATAVHNGVSNHTSSGSNKNNPREVAEKQKTAVAVSSTDDHKVEGDQAVKNVSLAPTAASVSEVVAAELKEAGRAEGCPGRVPGRF
jgi:hypothetical protein